MSSLGAKGLRYAIRSLGPIIHLPLHEGAGAAGAVDLSGYERGGTYEGSPTLGVLTDDISGGARTPDLDGTDDYISTGYATRRNRATKPSFEDGVLSPWVSNSANATGHTVEETSVRSDWAAHGLKSGYVRASTTIDNTSTKFPGLKTPSGLSGQPVPGGASQVAFRAIANVLQRSSAALQFLVRFYDSGGAWLGGATDVVVDATAGTGEKTLSKVGSVPASAAFWQLIFYNSHPAATANVFEAHLDKIQVHFTGDVPDLNNLPAYFDGDTHLDSAWEGTAHASASAKGPFANGSKRTFFGLALRDSAAARHALISGGVAGSPILFMNALDQIQWMPSGAEPASIWTDPTTLGRFFSWALTFDEAADKAELFIDAASQGALTQAEVYPTSGEKTLRVGARAVPEFGPPEFFDGRIAHVAIFPRILTADEIAYLAKNARAG